MSRANIAILAVALGSLSIALVGCSTAGDAILQTLPYAYGSNPAVDKAKRNPHFRYLRVTTGAHVALLALGNIDHNPQGQIEVWYSAEKEVLRLQNGRIVGATGLTTEWRGVVLSGIRSWSSAARSGETSSWTRTRDVMPGYIYGVRDELSLRVVAPPQRSALQALDPHSLTWFEERVESGQGSSLRPARYAVDFRGGRETVIYGEQCLSADLCLAWQRWPAQAEPVGQK